MRAGGPVLRAPHSRVPRRIVEMGHHRGVDAIVLGSNRRRLGRLFSGRVRARVTRRTPLPIFTAPSPLKLGATSRRGAVAALHLAPGPGPTASP